MIRSKWSWRHRQRQLRQGSAPPCRCKSPRFYRHSGNYGNYGRVIKCVASVGLQCLRKASSYKAFAQDPAGPAGPAVSQQCQLNWNGRLAPGTIPGLP